MNSTSSDEKITKGIFWVGFEKIGKQIIQFALGIIIARLLSPSDYGLIGMINIFIAISGSIVDGGFHSALIQNNSPLKEDYSTVFLLNFFTGIVIYIILFFTAPFIANFYNQPILVSVTRIFSITIIINSLDLVQKAKFSIEMRFKEQSKIFLFSLILSGIIGVFCAINGFGVWSLVLYSLSESFIRVLLFYIYSKWIPLGRFSIASFKKFSKFGYKILGYGIVNAIYNNLHALVIGRVLNSSDVGYYNRSKNFTELPPTLVSQIILKVFFPLLSKYKNQEEKFNKTYELVLSFEMYILLPTVVGLFCLSEPLILGLLSEKWKICILPMKILCISALFIPIEELNISTLNSFGKAGISFLHNIIVKPFSIVLILISIKYGIIGMCVSKALMSLLSYLMSSFFIKKYLNFSFKFQYKPFLRPLFQSFIMGFLLFGLSLLIPNSIILLITGIISGAALYFILGWITKSNLQKYLLNLVLHKKNSENN